MAEEEYIPVEEINNKVEVYNKPTLKDRAKGLVNKYKEYRRTKPKRDEWAREEKINKINSQARSLQQEIQLTQAKNKLKRLKSQTPSFLNSFSQYNNKFTEVRRRKLVRYVKKGNKYKKIVSYKSISEPVKRQSIVMPNLFAMNAPNLFGGQTKSKNVGMPDILGINKKGKGGMPQFKFY